MSNEPLITSRTFRKFSIPTKSRPTRFREFNSTSKKANMFPLPDHQGVGKSTLLSILGLLDTPTDGHYVLNENAVANLSMSQRARIRNREVGFIFQSFNLIGDLTVYENVELRLTYRGMTSTDRKSK